MTIRLFITGGTFDKEYNEIEGILFFNKTHMREMLRMGRCKLNIKIKTLMMIDSLEMTDKDRKIIVENCMKTKEEKIVITHGTDKMVKTAEILANSVKNKTIVLTGAMIPYKFGSSDGLFNLGSSLAFVQSLTPGIYISMNGKCFDWNNVRKNKETGNFEKLNISR